MNRPAPPGPDPKDFGTLIARLVAVADDAVIVTDARQQIVFFNDSAERVFGRGWQSVLGKPLAILLPESRRAAHEEHMRRFAASNQPARSKAERAEIQGQRGDGSLFEAEASIAQIAWDGKTYFAAILRDVSEARQAARALRRSEARFRELAASAPVGIFQTDASGAWVYVNERWCTMTGMSEAEAMGGGWQLGLHPSDRSRVSGALHAAIETRSPFEGEFR
ncbi:MAG: PAS domain S-box protein, partial [Rhizobacter sp.]|nr:PAS domain S-box protein [Rhizobacter sp.]